MLQRLLLTLIAVTVGANAAVRSEMLVSTAWLADHLNDAKLVILHVGANRTSYDAGHIPGARFLAQSDIVVSKNGVPNELPPVADLERVLEAAGVSDDSRVILYADGSVLPATRAYFTLDYLGLGAKASLLDGGLQKWNEEKRKVTAQAPAVKAGSLTPKPQAKLLADINAVKDMTGKAGAAGIPTILDARPAGDYSKAHIPTALQVDWVEGQVSRNDVSLKSEVELRALYADVDASKPVVTYCNSGMQATQAYFTLKYLGYDVKLYDGSMSEWNASGNPTATK